ncbi:NAD(P)H-dependent oxidoreductase [Paenibacillus sp. 1P07SE]|uniref:NAD(P)H-dependent oxidoreductase n=1 Tax=Paenibacillus sp. 1P07SE TaxID=3132209 RepID=UPI0039A6E887
MKSKIAIITGHPDPQSYCAALSAAYGKGAGGAGTEVRHIDLSQLDFNPNLAYGYRQRTELEEDLLEAQETIRWADHLVFVYPTWWGSVPAVLKGFIDRVFLPGFAYRYRKDSIWWDKLLQGRSAHLIVTLDTPSIFNRLIYRRAGHRVMKHNVLGFCGVKPVRITEITPVRGSSPEQRERWLSKVQRLGAARA